MPRRRSGPGAGIAYPALRAALGLLGLLPWRARLWVAGRLGRSLVMRSRRLRARVFGNLGHVMPETSDDERRRIAAATGECFGRTALELFSSRAFEKHHPWTDATGPGLATIEKAISENTGAIIVSGHYGGWEATRAWLKERGRPGATVYRPVRNERLDAFYRESVAFTGSPMLPKGRLAVRTLVRHLARGGFVTLLVDQYERGAPELDFIGRPAPTTLVPAELALKFRVPLIPAFATRRMDGRIDIFLDAPVPPGTPKAMMQAVNNSLAAQVRANPGQYYWLHRRWSKALPSFAAEDRPKRRTAKSASRTRPHGGAS